MLGEEIGKVLNILIVCFIIIFVINNNIKINKIVLYFDKLEIFMNNFNYMSIVKELEDGYSICFFDILNMFKVKGMINIVYILRYF